MNPHYHPYTELTSPHSPPPDNNNYHHGGPMGGGGGMMSNGHIAQGGGGGGGGGPNSGASTPVGGQVGPQGPGSAGSMSQQPPGGPSPQHHQQMMMEQQMHHSQQQHHMHQQQQQQHHMHQMHHMHQQPHPQQQHQGGPPYHHPHQQSPHPQHHQQQQQHHHHLNNSNSNNNNNNNGTVKVCAGCGGKIVERFLLHALDRYWHNACLKCTCCGATLADIGGSCFTKAGMILCKQDYLRLFGSTGACAACGQTIPASEFVMRAGPPQSGGGGPNHASNPTGVFHLKCFACSKCQAQLMPGDRYYLLAGSLVCEQDWHKLLKGAAATTGVRKGKVGRPRRSRD
ncbi:uncharacterized protein [Hetaerina americana]|uniref:uncharacterized protein n=1 Tax=Hetaerina americana TaxID=62018 RepID=UPI003A7F295E